MHISNRLMSMGSGIAGQLAETVPGLSCWSQGDEGREGQRRIVLGRKAADGQLQPHCTSIVFVNGGIAVQHKEYERKPIADGFEAVVPARNVINAVRTRHDMKGIAREIVDAIRERPTAFEPMPEPGVGTSPLLGPAYEIARDALEEIRDHFEYVGGLEMRLNEGQPGKYLAYVITFHTAKGETLPVGLRAEAEQVKVFDPTDYHGSLKIGEQVQTRADIKRNLVREMSYCGIGPNEVAPSPAP